MANEFKIKKGLIVTGSGGTLLDIQGSQGQLFSVTDDLFGDIFTVSDISGIPQFNVNSDGNTTAYGPITAPSFKTPTGTASEFLKANGTVDTNIYLTSIDGLDVTTALGYTPYDGTTNPNGYTTNSGTVTSVNGVGGTGINITGGPITSSGALTITNTAPNITTNLSTTTSTTTNTVVSSDGTNAVLLGATTSVAGVMTAADKLKLDGIATGAQANTPTNLSIGVSSGTQVRVDSSTGTNTDIPNASATLAGILTTGSQTIGGVKTFSNTISGSITGNAGTATALTNMNISQFTNNSNYLTTIGGITAGGELTGTYTNPSLLNGAVISKILTGLNLSGGGTINTTDTILTAFGKIQNQLSGVLGGVTYQGTWNASTNTPTLTSSVGVKGHYYIVTNNGSTNLNGVTDWKIGDWVIFNGTTWDKVDNTDAVSSVNGFTGAVSLTTANINENTNLYYTDARVNANSNVAANTAARHNPVTLGTANGLSLTSQQLSLGLASSTTTGALTSAGWVTFNNKENALTFSTGLSRVGNTVTNTISQYTNTLARTAISLTNTGTSGVSVYNSTTGFLNIPNYNLTGLGGQPLIPHLEYDNAVKTLWNNGNGNIDTNTSFGDGALRSNTVGERNTANGYNSLYANIKGEGNTANGYNALYSNTTSNYNTANGYNALYSNVGNGNTANGYVAGLENITGAENVFLGYNSQPLNDDENNQIVIGANTTGLGTNTVVLGNNEIITTALKGNVGIGTITPNDKIVITKDNNDYSTGLVINNINTGGAANSGLNLTVGGKSAGINFIGGDYLDMFINNGFFQVRPKGVTSLVVDYDTTNNRPLVGIGIGNPSYPLQVNANTNGTSIYATHDIVAFSDITVKENIRPIDNVIQRIEKSRGVLYDRNDSENKDNIGFIAQELEKQFPELVIENPDGTKAVKYQNATAVLFEAVKEQQKQINNLEGKINEILKRLDNGITN